MRSILQDILYGWRMMLRAPGFAFVAVLTLALGIGANSTVFSWINSTLLNPIPGVSRTADLASVSRGTNVESPFSFSYLDYLDLREQSRSFSGLVASDIRPMDLTGRDKPERIWGTISSANYFDVLGVKPILGRGFLPGEDQKPGAAPVVVISYRLWQTHFGGEPAVVGQAININQQPFTVIGVTPPVFQGSQTGLRSDLWIPVTMQRPIASNNDWLHTRSDTWLMLLGRLRSGVSIGQAQQELNLLMQQIAARFPDSHRGINEITVYPLWRAPFGANAYIYVFLPILMVIAGVVLLLACTNVANLLLVRSVSRRREIAIRLSMGAGPWRLVRQLMLENLILGLMGGALALLITTWTAGVFPRFFPPSNLPIDLNVPVDRSVVLATLSISIITVLVFSILPALRSSRLTPLAVLQEESSSASGAIHKARLSSALVTLQVAFSLLLLICAGLFIRAFGNAQHFDPGFNEKNVLLASYDLFPAGYASDRGLEFHRQLLAKLETVPGIESVTLANWVPLGFSKDTTIVSPEGYVPRLHESMDTGENAVGPNYFRTMQIPLVEGREFTFEDTARTQPVAIVNQALADRYWPHQEALGKRIHAEDRWFVVVGVARNSCYYDLNDAAQPFIYLPLFQDYNHWVMVHARVAGDPLAYEPEVEQKIHELSADLPVFDISTLEARVQTVSTNTRIAATFVGGFGVIALALAAVGIYGVIAYSTRQRRREIGIRMALGAKRVQVLQLVLGQGLRLTLAGIVAGLALSLVSTRFLKSLLFGITATDGLTFAGVALLLCVVALIACYIPARRATRVNPMEVLRYE